MARWSREKQAEIRKAILAAAKDAFEDQGFDVTMRYIAAEVGVASGTLFNYFPNKYALLEEALFADLEQVIKALLLDLHRIEWTDLTDLFAAVATALYRYWAQRPKLSRIMLSQTLFFHPRDAQSSDSARPSRLRQQAERVAQELTYEICEMQSRGYLDPDASPHAITLAFFSHYYFILISHLGGDDNIAEMVRLIRLLARQLESGVGPSTSIPLSQEST